MIARPTLDGGPALSRRPNRWLDGPWLWLCYLPFYAIPWLWRPPSTGQVAAFALGLAVFLPVYLLGHGWRGARLLAAATVVLMIGIVLAPAGGSWTVFCIYAAAMAGTSRPTRAALGAIGFVAAATIATAVAWGQPLVWWLPGVLLIVTTGAATASREAFYERTQALLLSQEEVRRLASMSERERIARDLHDVVGRTLTLVALKADLATKLVKRDSAAAQAETRAIADAARAGLAEVRAALAGQAGGSLVHEAAASLAALETAGVSATVAGDPADLPDGAGAILAMTLREAVTNVIRHAGASRCEISVERQTDTARLVVVDDGRTGAFADGNGLSGMRQRIAAAGGTLAITVVRPGIRLVASVPL